MNPIREGLERLRESGWRHDIGTCMYLSIMGSAEQELAILDAVSLEQFPERAKLRSWDNPTFAVNDNAETTFDDIERIMEKAALRLDEIV